MLVALTLAPLPARARQCTPALQDAIGLPGTNGLVRCSTVWDPDGPGPSPPRLVIGGSFFFAGSIFARGLIAWDGTRWMPMDSGLTYPLSSGNPDGPGVYSLAALPSGELFAAVNTGNPAVYRWTGASWSNFAYTSAGSVNTLVATPAGELLVGGSFSSAGGVLSNCVARWNGTSWSSLGMPTPFGTVRALAVAANGDIIAGGQFGLVVGPPSANTNIARWNGSSWSTIGSGLSGDSSQVRSLLVLPNGDIIAAGRFTSAGLPVRNVARWNGAAWSPVGDTYPGGGSVNSFVRTLLPLSNGDFLAGGGWNPAFVSRWDGQTWTNLGSGMQQTQSWISNESSQVSCIAAMPDGKLIAGGVFTETGAHAATCIAQWDGASWLPLTRGIGRTSTPQTHVEDAATLAGDLVLAGQFSEIEGVPVANIARRTSSGWVPLGSGLGLNQFSPYNGPCHLATSPSGDLFASGAFTSAGGTAANHIARWDGASWHALGAGIPSFSSPASPVGCMTVMPNGDVIAAGFFTQAGTIDVNNIARWNGSDWSPLGAGLGNDNNEAVRALVPLPGGDLIAGGTFTTASGAPANGIARWNGATWSTIGSGVISGQYVSRLITLPSGDIVAAGNFTSMDGVPAANIARWNGQSWSPLGTGLPGGTSFGFVSSLGILLNGDLIAGGLFSIEGAPQAYDVARWDGHSWSLLTNDLIPLNAPSAVLTLPTGEVIVAGTSEPIQGYATFTPVGFLASLTCTPCYPNCDSSTTAPILNINDFQCFLNKFAAADPYANCDHSTTPPTLTANDFQCFLNAFATGCP